MKGTASNASAGGLWSRPENLLFTQTLVQGVNLGCSVLAVGILPAREVGLLALQTAIAAWLYFTHAGTLNHLFNELPRLDDPGQSQRRETMLRGAIGVLTTVSLPLTLIGCVPFVALFNNELERGEQMPEFFLATILSVVGAQWTQVKECDIKSRGIPDLLARWNLLQAASSALPLLLLVWVPAYHLLLFRASIGQATVAAIVLIGEGAVLFRPVLHDIASYMRGGFHLVLCQALSVLILQGERLLVARYAGVTVVGELQLYFLLQTGVQLIPATVTNLWFPAARREPTREVLRTSLTKALRFSVVSLGAFAIGGVLTGMALRQGWAGEAYRRAADGLIIGSLVAPAHMLGSLLFIYMAKDRVPVFVFTQIGVFVSQAILYSIYPHTGSIYVALAIRGAILYVALFAGLITTWRLIRKSEI